MKRTQAVKEAREQVKQPVILRYTQENYTGAISHTYTRDVIGYVVKGSKRIYYGNTGYEIGEGDMFFLSSGHYHIEDVPRNGMSEQIIFYYGLQDLNKILNTLGEVYKMHIGNDHSCEKCTSRQDTIYPAWPLAKDFFMSVSQYFREGIFLDDPAAESMKATELIYLILSNRDCCIKRRIMNAVDMPLAIFEKVVRENIWTKRSLKELARDSNRSLSKFKEDFRKYYNDTPANWFRRQRLSYSRLWLAAADKSVSQIAEECNFSSPSHYARAFKNEFGISPAEYRRKNGASNDDSQRIRHEICFE